MKRIRSCNGSLLYPITVRTIISHLLFCSKNKKERFSLLLLRVTNNPSLLIMAIIRKFSLYGNSSFLLSKSAEGAVALRYAIAPQSVILSLSKNLTAQ